MNVMSKLDARYAGRWAGQYHVEMVPKSRRIDFALQLPDGRGIGIEFDGYSSHGNLDIVKFQDQIDRNNALVAKGWVLLRFSYIDAKEHADSCINIINGIFNSANAIGSARLPWVHCAHCQGKMTHTIIKGKPYWKCENCLKLFFDNNGKPSKNEVVSRNT